MDKLDLAISFNTVFSPTEVHLIHHWGKHITSTLDIGGALYDRDHLKLFEVLIQQHHIFNLLSQAENEYLLNESLHLDLVI